MPNSIIEIDKRALANNIGYIRSLIQDDVVLSCVLKGNAYGHGISIMVPTLQELGVNHFSVFNSLEARQVFEQATGDFTIMIMGDISTEEAEWIIENDIEFYAFNLHRIQNMLKIAQAKSKSINIHLEIETGMNRTGFNQSDWQELSHLILNNEKLINVKGICTHYAGAESISNYMRVKLQRNIFKKAIRYFKNEGIEPERVHSSCSAAVLAFPQDNFDMVRIGILQYGLWPSRESFISHMTKNELEIDPLKPILTWTSYIMDIKHVNKGEYIGYGNSYLAENNMTIASVPIGYGYGYSRSLSNQGRVIVNNNRFSVIGTVNMNMILIDISADSNVKINDKVVLIGKNGNHDITVSSFGNITDQLNYEVLSRIDKDIPRVLKK